MAIKKYLYREDEQVFFNIEAFKEKHKPQKYSTKDAMTYLINLGFETDKNTEKVTEVVEKVGE